MSVAETEATCRRRARDHWQVTARNRKLFASATHSVRNGGYVSLILLGDQLIPARERSGLGLGGEPREQRATTGRERIGTKTGGQPREEA